MTNNTDAEIVSETAIVRSQDLMISPLVGVEEARDRLKQLQELVDMYLRKDEDYGIIPGTPKPTLLKPGADKLCDIYGMADSYRILARIVDFDRGLFDYEIECVLTNVRTKMIVRTGLGSCSSFESRYLYRNAKPVCPKCGKDTIIKGKKEFGGGWLCWKKLGRSDGCGAKWPDGASEIESQATGKIRVPAEELASIKNTVLKVAKKRALVDATIAATRSSGLFTQDVEDMRKSRKYNEDLPPEAFSEEADPFEAEAAQIAEAHHVTAPVGTRQAAQQVAQDNILAGLKSAYERIDPESYPYEYAQAKQQYDKRRLGQPLDIVTSSKPDSLEADLKASISVQNRIEAIVEQLAKIPRKGMRGIELNDEYAKLKKLAPSKVEEALDKDIARVLKDDEQKKAGLLTSKQQRALHAIWTRYKWPQAEVWRTLNQLWALPKDENGKVSSASIKAADFEDVCKRFEKKFEEPTHIDDEPF